MITKLLLIFYVLPMVLIMIVGAGIIIKKQRRTGHVLPTNRSVLITFYISTLPIINLCMVLFMALSYCVLFIAHCSSYVFKILLNIDEFLEKRKNTK